MKKHKQKKKRALRNPPLSFLDNLIYTISLIVFAVPPFLVMLMLPMIQKHFAFFKDASLVACYSRATLTWGILFFVFLAATPIVYIATPYANKKPIFGNKKITYGVYPWISDCYPRFGKQGKKTVLTEKKKKSRRIKLIAWLIVFAILFSIFPFSMFGRECLYEDNSITYYNMANKSYAEYDAEDFSHLSIKTGWHRNSVRSITGYWYYAIEIEMKDGEVLYLNHSDFRYDYDDEKTLNKMLEIKKLFKSDEITIVRADDVEVIIDEFDMNENETELIKELFDIK